MSGHGNSTEQFETTTLGTLGWVGVVVVLGLACVLLLSALGPVGAN